MKLWELSTLFIILTITSLSLQECDPKTCQYCCIVVNGEPTCKDEVLQCRLVNKRHYADVAVLVCIVVFWCIGVPFVLQIAKQVLVHPICCGYTIFSIIKRLASICYRQGKKRQILKRQKATSQENIGALKKMFQRRMQIGSENRQSDSPRKIKLMTAQKKHYWNKDDLFVK